MSAIHLKYHKGLKVDRSEWEVVCDTYSLLDPSHHIPASPRFAFSADPFLVLWDRAGRHNLRAGIRRTDEGRKIWWFEWLREGQTLSYANPESLQQLLYCIDSTLFEIHKFASKHARRKKR